MHRLLNNSIFQEDLFFVQEDFWTKVAIVVTVRMSGFSFADQIHLPALNVKDSLIKTTNMTK